MGGSSLDFLSLVIQVLGTPPVGYEYLPYKTACVLLILFMSAIISMILLFQRSMQRGK